jgi:hypothetical protein
MISQLRVMGLLAALAVALLLLSESACAQATGLAIVAIGKGKAVFLARDGKLYRADLQGGNETIGRDRMKPVKTDVDYPIEVTAAGDRLLITDGILAEVSWYDPSSSSPEIDLAVRLRSFANPTRLAVADSGDIAAYDANERQLLINPAKRVGKAVEIQRSRDGIPVPGVLGIAYNGNKLIVLKEGSLHYVDPTAARNAAKPAIQFIANLPSGIGARAIAAANGALYVLYQSGIAVVTQPDYKLLPLVAHAGRPHRLLAVDRELLVTYSDQLDEIHVTQQKFQPVLFSVEGDKQQVEAGIVAVYDYLERVNPATVGQHTARHDYPSVAEWLIDEGLIPEGLSAVGEDSVAARLCKANLGSCGPRALKAPVKEGATILFPRVPSEIDTVVRKQRIENSVGEYNDALPERFKLSSKQLSDINVDSLGNLDSTLTRAGMLLAAPLSSNLKAGDVVVFENGRESRIGSLEGCSKSGFRAMASPTALSLPHVSVTSAGIDAVPIDRLPLEKKRAQVARAKIEYRDPSTESFSVEDPNRAAACLDELTANIALPIAVVGDVLRAKSASVTLLAADGKPIVLTKDELFNLGLTSDDSGPTGAFNVPFEFSVAFRPTTPTETQPVRFETPNDFLQLKPDLPQNARNLSKGEFSVPRFVWRMWGVVPRSEIAEKESAGLQTFSAPSATVYAFPLVSFDFRPQANSAPSIDDAAKNRAELQAANGYKPFLSRTTNKPVIGIIENEKYLKLDHPAFVDDGQSVWVTDNSGSFERSPTAPNNRGAGAVRTTVSTAADHGTHVGAIITSLDRNIPGFAPYADLFLLDSKDGLPSIQRKVDKVSSRIKVVNFSQATASDGSLTDLKKKIANEWPPKLLFVVAAGNAEMEGGPSGVNLNDSGATLALIGWVRDARQNMIGVAATDFAGQIIEQCAVDPAMPTRKVGCSNYGSKFVQIAAPGYRIMSAGDQYDYVLSSGTSMAAPQVTATAALILQRAPGATPAQLKSRLISTSDFDKAYKGKISGGRLNMARAVVGSDIDTETAVISGLQDPDKSYLIRFKSNWTLKIRSGERYSAGSSLPNDLPVGNLLRLQFDDSNNKYWMVYIRPDNDAQFQIAQDVEFEAMTIPIKAISSLDPSGDFKLLSQHKWLDNGVPLNELLQFVGPMPRVDPQFPE